MRFFSSGRGRDLLIIGLFFALPLIVFAQQTLGGRTLIPAENLYQYQPYAAYRDQAGAPAVPYNHLVSDLVLENYQWKSFIREQLAHGEFPLWNPHQFSGIAFFAAGQQSTLYPFSLLYYVLPLWLAYGWFTVIQMWLAGVLMYAFTRGLGIGRFGGTIAGGVYQLSALFIISAVFPMIIASMVWLPLILLMIEYMIVKPRLIPLWIVIGAGALGCNILAGHVEITYYTLIIAGFYAAARLLIEMLHGKGLVTRHLVPALAMLGMVILGAGLGAIQFVPLFQAASGNFRTDSATLDQVLGWAHPFRDAVQFALPNFYGNPSHHSVFDVFTLQNTPMTVNALGETRFHTEWGIKNYVEAALYVGILPLILAVYALIPVGRKRNSALTPSTERGLGGEGKHRWIFAILGAFSLTVMFGLPTYALLYSTLPGINQLHSPFRWVFGLTISVAVLAAFGAEKLAAVMGDRRGLMHQTSTHEPIIRTGEKQTLWIGRILIGLGALVLIGLIASRLLYDQVTVSLIERVFSSMAQATSGFPDARAFYSYQFVNMAIFGVMLLGSGIVFWWAARQRPSPPAGREGEKSDGSSPDGAEPVRARAMRSIVGVRAGLLWQTFTVLLIAADLMIASYSFNPASDPAWLDYTPPAITWLQNQPGEWRYTTLDDPTQPYPQLFNANMTLRYGLDDIRGYESIIPKTYVDFMRELAPQVQTDFNRVAPLYTVYPAPFDTFDYRTALTSPLLDELNVRYVITHTTTDLSAVEGYTLAYEDDAVRIWEQAEASGRVFAAEDSANAITTAPTITQDTGREFLIDVTTSDAASLIISESGDPGWRAFLRPQGMTEQDESPLTVGAQDGALMRVDVPEAGAWTVRLVYSPQSFFVGAAVSFISGIVCLLLIGVWAWRRFVNPSVTGGEASGVQVIAKNSLAPIILNLFNRGVDMAFALVMLRILGPADSGLYYYAGVVFVWFDIFTNFGLNLHLIREASRDRARAGHLFLNTSVLRVLLIGVGVPLLIGFLTVRQSAADPLPIYAVTSIIVLYIGLLPNSLSNGLSALYYAYERAEIPAATATIATIAKVCGQLAALLFGYGIVGLAAVSIIVNFLTLFVLWINSPLRQERRKARQSEEVGDMPNVGMSMTPSTSAIEPRMIGQMVRESYPLMLNHFLATIFFQVDVILIEWIHNPTMVGQYSVAYKWVSALNIIPAFFTQALLPMMSRQAHEDKAALKRNITMGYKLLMSVALPIAVIFTFTAFVLAGLLGGSEYLPQGAIATQLMIWSIPFGWMNSLTQYVLIALDLQKQITRAFVVAVGFNIIANLIFIPPYGYQAAALTTIASEITLLIAFSVLLHGSIGWINWFAIAWKPFAAAAAMFAVLGIGFDAMPFVALIISVLVYVGVLIVLRPLNADELARLAPLIPHRMRGWAMRAA